MSREDKLRILAIHGYRQSDKLFSGKLGSLRKSFKRKLDFVFIRGAHSIPQSLECPDEQDESLDQDSSEFGWWFNTEDRTYKATEPSSLSVGFEDSLALVEQTFRKFGPFDGILGFSQGAAFASILCAMQQKKLLSASIKFEFAIIISGFKSLCEPHACLYDERVSLPTLHVYGETDKIIPTAMSKELADIFDNSEIITHEGGHYVPGKKQIYEQFLNKVSSNM